MPARVLVMAARSRGPLKTDEDLEANRGAETSVYLADDDAVGRKSATYAAARGTSTKWPPSVKLASPRAGAPPLGGHFVEVPVAAA